MPDYLISDTPNHLAGITPVDRRDSQNILGVTSLLAHSFLLVAFQAGWVVLMFASLFVLRVSTFAGVGMASLAFAWLAMQFVLVFAYPEWPLNRLLSWRLRQSIEMRKSPLVSPSDDEVRVVELVPRERWRKLSLETATDLMLLKIDESGVWMTGDRNEYALPSASIIGVELHSTKPPGWFTATHMAILTIRTDQGPTELPISYRDHGFGTLSSRRRQRQAMELVEKIAAVARGQMYQPPTAPPAPHLDAAQLDVGSRRSPNPYQTPTIV